jgi:hypothetical protein
VTYTRAVIAKWAKQFLYWGSMLHAIETVKQSITSSTNTAVATHSLPKFLKETLKIMREIPVTLHCHGQFKKKHFPTKE